ncbi:hypothetical protein ACFL6U_03280 [Planctomycetota bacterium]
MSRCACPLRGESSGGFSFSKQACHTESTLASHTAWICTRDALFSMHGKRKEVSVLIELALDASGPSEGEPAVPLSERGRLVDQT